MRTMPRNAMPAWAARPERSEKLDSHGTPTGEFEVVLGEPTYFLANAHHPLGAWYETPMGYDPNLSIIIVACTPPTDLEGGLSLGDYVWLSPEKPDVTARPLPQPAYRVKLVSPSPNGVSYDLAAATGVM